MIAMRVGVEDKEAVAVAGMGGKPGLHKAVDNAAQREEVRGCGRAGIDQDGPGVAEQQEHERRLVVDRHVLAQDERVPVVGVDLDVRVRVVLRRLRAVDPGHLQVSGPGAACREVDQVRGRLHAFS